MLSLVQLNCFHLLQLPYDLCEAHARFVARHRIQRLKRCVGDCCCVARIATAHGFFGGRAVVSYYVGRVFRGSSAASGGAPKEIHEAAFDIVWDCRSRESGVAGDGDDRRLSLEYSGAAASVCWHDITRVELPPRPPPPPVPPCRF